MDLSVHGQIEGQDRGTAYLIRFAEMGLQNAMDTKPVIVSLDVA